jgi:hypothetical protein
MRLVKDALTRVSLSHAQWCDCITCRAAAGDEYALIELLDAVRDLAAADVCARCEESVP